MSERRHLGHVLIAIRLSAFRDPAEFKSRLALLLNELRAEPRWDPNVPIQVAGDPEKRTARQRHAEGVPLPRHTFEALVKAGEELGVALEDNAVPRAA